MKYEKPQVASLPDAIESVLAGSLMKSAPITDGPGSKSLAYSSKDGGVKVEVQNGKVSSVEKPKS